MSKPRVAYSKLRENSISALMGALEIYNKPRFSYREEVAVVLLINAWELILKAMIAKSRNTIHRPKKSNEDWKTFSLSESLFKAQKLTSWPSSIPKEAISENLNVLVKYRDNVIHFYNDESLNIVAYGLIQTSIIAYTKLLKEVFEKDFSKEITWRLLPLGTAPPSDPVEYLRSGNATHTPASAAVEDFLGYLRDAVTRLEDAGVSTTYFLTSFSVKLESTKKLSATDVVMGVGKELDHHKNGHIVIKSTDPNTTHPLSWSDILGKVPDVSKYALTAYCWKFNLRANPAYCWTANGSNTRRWSHEIVSFLKTQTQADTDKVIKEYSKFMKDERMNRVQSSKTKEVTR